MYDEDEADMIDAPPKLPICDQHPDAAVSVVRPARPDSLISPLRYGCHVCGKLLPGDVSELNRIRYETHLVKARTRAVLKAAEERNPNAAPHDLADRLFKATPAEPDERSLAARIIALRGR